MIRTYKLAVETETGMQPIPHGPFTLEQAEKLREKMRELGKVVHIINLKTL
jgi:hypothetical protein